MYGISDELRERVEHLEEELGRRYRELEALKARCSELEEEAGHHAGEARGLRALLLEVRAELEASEQGRRAAERDLNSLRRRTNAR